MIIKDLWDFTEELKKEQPDLEPIDRLNIATKRMLAQNEAIRKTKFEVKRTSDIEHEYSYRSDGSIYWHYSAKGVDKDGNKFYLLYDAFDGNDKNSKLNPKSLVVGTAKSTYIVDAVVID